MSAQLRRFLARSVALAVLALAAMLMPCAHSNGALFDEDFETDVTAGWTINGGPSDEAANFFFDYTTLGIPLAPNSIAAPGANRGLKLQANQFSEILGGVSVSPTGESFAENHVVKFDWWSNFNGPFPVGGSGSTQFSTFGVGTSGTVAQWTGGTHDSVWFGATGDGNTTFDWRAYSNDPANAAIGGRYPENSGVYAAGTGNGSTNAANPYYSSFGNVSAPAAQVALFPQQTGTTQTGSVGMEWHEVEIEKRGSSATWTVDGVLIAAVDLSGLTLGGNNIFFGHSDVNATSSTDPNDAHLLFTLIDNVSVEELLPIHLSETLIASGNWSDGANWSSGAAPINNDDFTYDAIINSGTVTVDQHVTIESLTLGGGTITGPAGHTLTLNGSSTWSGGTMAGAGQTTIDPAGTLTIDGLNSSPHELSRTLVNEGSTTWTGYNHIRMNGGTFQNNGSFTAHTSGDLLQAFGIGGTNVFNNAGTFTKTGPGTAHFAIGTTGVTFNNTGTLHVQEGELILGSGGTHTADFTGLAGASLQLNGNHTLAANVDITGGLNVLFSLGTSTHNGTINTSGLVNFYSGTSTVEGSLSAGSLYVGAGGITTFNGPVTAGSLNVGGIATFNETLDAPGGTITHGALTGTANWTVTSALTWTLGAMDGSGQTTIDPDGTLTIDGLLAEPHELGRTLVNEGSTTWTGNNHIRTNSGTFQNNSSFTAHTSSPDHLLQAFGIGGTNVFNNVDTFTKTGPGTAQFVTATTSVVFNNTGYVDVQGGLLHLESDVSQHVDSQLIGGSWRIGPNATLQFGTGPSITTSFADVTLDGAGSVFAKINSLVDNRGAFSIIGGRNFSAVGPFSNSGIVTIGSGSTFTAASGFNQTASGVLRGTGTLVGNLQNDGALRPGNSPGILEIDGNYIQSSTGVLEIEVGGLTPGTEHDLVIVSGFASIAGRLDVPIFGNYVPAENDEVTFLTADVGREGTFGSIFSPNLASVNPNVAIEVLYDNPNNVRLRFVAPSTAIEFVTDEPESSWTGFGTWTDGEEPDSTNIVTVKNDSAGPQQVNVTHGSAFVHELSVVGETDTIKLSIQNGSNFSATTGVTVDSKGVVELDQGNLISSQVQVQPGGVLSGNGTVTGNVIVGAASGEADATLRPGLSVGHFGIQGNYEQRTGGTLAIEVDGAEVGQFDTITVSGGAKLGGMLVVDASELETIAPGTVIPVLVAGNLAAGATFEDVQTIGNNEIYFAPTYVPGPGTPSGLAAGSETVCNSGTMCVSGYFKGDMNRNGAFDAGDIQSFALALTRPPDYHSAFGLFGTAPGDLDGWGTPSFSPNGRLDFDDIRGFSALMASNGVTTAGLGAAIAALQNKVPEPSAIMLVLGGGMAVMAVYRRQRRRLRSAK